MLSYTSDIIQNNTSLALWPALISSKTCFSGESWACSSREPFSCICPAFPTLAQRLVALVCLSCRSRGKQRSALALQPGWGEGWGERERSAALHPLQVCSTAPSPGSWASGGCQPLHPTHWSAARAVWSHRPKGSPVWSQQQEKRLKAFPLFPTELILGMWSTPFTKRVY